LNYKQMKTIMNEVGHDEFVRAVSKYLEKRKKRAVENNIFPVTKIASGAINPGHGLTMSQT